MFLSFVVLSGKLLRVFYNEDCLRCGVFLGSFVAIFKVCELKIPFNSFAVVWYFNWHMFIISRPSRFNVGHPIAKDCAIWHVLDYLLKWVGGGTPKELHWDPFQCTQDTQATKQSPFTKVFRGQPWGVNKLEGKLWNHTANLILGFSTASAVTCRPSCPLLTLVATIEPAVHINNPSKALLWRQPSVNAC